MDTVDGSLTGAPSAGTSYVNRLHFEQNQTLAVSDGSSRTDDMYAWNRISSSSSATAYYSFTSPGTTGSGTVRVSLAVAEGSSLRFTATVNGSVMADTIKAGSGTLVWEFPVTGLKASVNSLALRIDKTAGSRASFVVYTDWLEVFPETGFKSWSSQCEVPLDRLIFNQQRKAISWAQNLSDESFVCMVLSDTAVVRIDIPGGNDFEVDMPDNWVEPVLWVVPGGSYKEPVSVAPASPGGIIETLTSGNTVYIYPDQFASDMPLFTRGRSDVVLLSLTEIYDEFNGGVRDPGAVRAFFHHALKHWTTPPDQLVLVGSGHFDPRGFTTEKPCPMDIILYRFYETLPVCSDFLYSVTEESTFPQAAVSRIAVESRTELQLVAQRSSEYSDLSQESGTWQSVVLGAADDERHPLHPTSDETYHTIDAEEIMASVVPSRFVPVRHYLINWDWNSNWNKPEARQDYIETWSRGALVSFYLGHGGFDQIADEGLLFIEDVDLLSCGPRKPYAFFGSCDVGVFQNPSYYCMAQKITAVAGGGAIVASGAACGSYGSSNAAYLTRIFNHMLLEPQYSIGECQWLGLVDGGFTSNDKTYIIFGDGSLNLALADSGFSVTDPDMFTSELCEIDGSLDRDGLVMLTAWESAVVDSYYTHNSSYLIEYISTPGVFYRGLAQASPDFSAEMFVPSFARVGDLGRVRYFAPGPGGGSLACSYPLPVSPGIASGDEEGPEMEIWLSGFRGVEHPSVSGSVVFEAALEDSSGINLLPYPGAQLALYIDDSPVDVSEFFTYDPGSATSGRIVYPLPELQPGDHVLRLRASDNVANISWEETTFHLTDSSSPLIEQLFVY
ncbi:MAG: C25 family cysteine peptidase, partial [Candidatus Fermentibacteria bacterium]|nr:C25 family cysteine peptidase [Candidatus Fermentibacteria bacterium]